MQCCAINYAFAVLTDTLKHNFDFSQTQVDLIGTPASKYTTNNRPASCPYIPYPRIPILFDPNSHFWNLSIFGGKIKNLYTFRHGR